MLMTFDEFQKANLRVVTIIAAERVPKSEKLLRLTMDAGNYSKQIIAGIGTAYEPEYLVGKQIPVIANLQPRYFLGIISQGMILCASTDAAPVILNPEQEVPGGTTVR
ncbi:methionine--tRNA ligase [Patescibacteria group bacterium]|jgi:methionine--tRNA ligase beta chain|nr:methionine--tRNA ligase [Patescibacteria group bacterium]